ncbi:MAG: tetratricopeptide repeat protein [Ilumatobacteraceae bacterium]
MQTRDSVGLDFTGTHAGASAFDDALFALLRFQPEVGSKVGNIIKADPSGPLGYIFSAYLGLLSSERPDGMAAADQLQTLEQQQLKLNEREKMHLQAAKSWSSGNVRSTARILDDINTAFPTDTLALYVGHQLDFYSGASQHLNDRLAAALPFWNESQPHYGYLSAMWAFGLEESGNYEMAEEVGRRAVEINKDDVWGIHAVIHVQEMLGNVDDGLKYLAEHEDDWMYGNFLNVHNSWHRALFLLELEKYGEALDLYDSVINNEDSANLALEMLDASALLWRLHLDNIDVGDRWQPLAESWASKDPMPYYFFNDMHACLTFVAAGRMSDAESIVSMLTAYMAQTDRHVTNRDNVEQVGLPICKAIVAHGRGAFAACAQLLDPIRDKVGIIGGSHAQRDLVHRTLIDSLQKSGSHSRAEQLLNQRLRDRPTSLWSSKRLVRTLPVA